MPRTAVLVLAALSALFVLPVSGQTSATAAFHIASGPDKSCDVKEDPCEVELKVHFKQIPGMGTTRYCLIEAPTVELKLATASPPRKVIWTLNILTPVASNDVEFLDDASGIKVFAEPHPHIVPNARGRGAGIGTGPIDKKKFHLHVSPQAVRKEATYLPMVLHFDVNGEPAVCAAVDPKIISRP